MPKIVFIDIDGTLVDKNPYPSERVVEALRAARRNGHKIFLCTGRAVVATEYLFDIGLDGYICSAGGYVVVDDKLIHESYLDDEDVRLAREVFEKNKILFNLECNHATYEDEEVDLAFTYPAIKDSADLQKELDHMIKLFNIKRMNEFDANPQKVQKMSFIATNENQIEIVKRELGDKYHVVIHQLFSMKDLIAGEIIIKTTDKGKAIQRVIDYLNIDSKDTICFGDSMNDYQMFKKCHLSIAVENGGEDIKAVADELCLPADQDGIYYKLKELEMI